MERTRSLRQVEKAVSRREQLAHGPLSSTLFEGRLVYTLIIHRVAGVDARYPHPQFLFFYPVRPIAWQDGSGGSKIAWHLGRNAAFGR